MQEFPSTTGKWQVLRKWISFQYQFKSNSFTPKEACSSETSEQRHNTTQRKDPE